ncbi:MAG: AAA family ATPase [Deltaproteobacteria bacterium]|nr:AAA family ATPase [Deltaproteobacteria bacterium]
MAASWDEAATAGGVGVVVPDAPPGVREPWLRFSGIVAQRHAIWRIQSAFLAGRLHHALLLDGPAGCGKSSVAVALAAALACRSRPPTCPPLPSLDELASLPDPVPWPLESCGSCASCRKMPEHPDLVRIGREEGKTRIAIEQVRALASELAYPPHESPLRVVLVREADRLTPEAANALLKTLEEPPAGNVVVLTTARAAHLLPTIRSRCLRVPLRPLPPGTVRKLLAREATDVDDAALDLAAGLSAGGLVRARELLGADAPAALAGLAQFGRAVAQGDVAALIGIAELLGPDRDRAAASLELLLVLLRDRLSAAVGGQTLLGSTAGPAAAAFESHPLEAVALEGQLVSAARRDLEANANSQMTFDWLGAACARAVARARRGQVVDV